MTDHTALDLAIIGTALLFVVSLWIALREPHPRCDAKGPAGRCELFDGHVGRHRTNHEGAIYWWDGYEPGAWSRGRIHYQVPDPDLHDPDPAEMRPRVLPRDGMDDAEWWR